MATGTEKYQGWTNHATWAAALHLGNSQGMYNDVQGLVADAYHNGAHAEPVKAGSWTADQGRLFTLADALKGYVAEVLFPDTGKRQSSDADLFRSDMLRGYFDDVDFHDIARHYLSDYEPA